MTRRVQGDAALHDDAALRDDTVIHDDVVIYDGVVPHQDDEVSLSTTRYRQYDTVPSIMIPPGIPIWRD